MSAATADVVICGAGIAGLAAAWRLAGAPGVGRVLIVDERPPLSLTSDKSTECYRNLWPGPDGAMVALMNRSIDLLDQIAAETHNAIGLNRRGYLYCTADPKRWAEIVRAAEQAESYGAGPLRRHPGADYRPVAPEGFLEQPGGVDLLDDPDLVRQHFPYLSADTLAAAHARRSGWFSGHALGTHMLERARAQGAALTEARLEAIEVRAGRVEAVRLAGPAGAQSVSLDHLVLAPGPFLRPLAARAGLSLPVACQLHLKASFSDSLGAIPRQAPLLIWADEQRLAWEPEERESLAQEPGLAWMLDELPSGAHTRPEGGGDSPMALLLWSYHADPGEPVFPLPAEPAFAELALRGVARMIPGLRGYLARLPRMHVDGGYYVKTPENRPLIGPTPVQGLWLMGAFAGFGLMAAPAAGELLAAHLTGGRLPDHAPAFALARYEDRAYQKRLERWGSHWEL